MRVLTVVHQRDAGPGVFEQEAANQGHELVEWHPCEKPEPPADPAAAVVVLGGAMHVDQEAEHPWLAGEKAFLLELLASGTPVLGVCLGAQLVAEAAGATPRRAARPEIGWHQVELAPAADDDPLLRELPRRLHAFEWHSYEFPLPPGAVALGSSAVCLQAFRTGRAWGVQFHAEVTEQTVATWLAKNGGERDAVEAGLDPALVRAQTAERIAGWNQAGRSIFAGFLAAAAARA